MESIVMLLIVLGAIAGIFILMKNSIIGLKNSVEKAASNIDVYLQQRLDLMQNLFSELERGLDHESTIFTEVARLRSRFDDIHNQYDNSSAESVVSTDKAVGAMFLDFQATRENYPELQGLELVENVMNENTRIEKEITAARRSYNSNVTSYRNAIQMFPTSLIANMSGYTDCYELYKADEQAKQRVKPMWEDHYANKYKQ